MVELLLDRNANAKANNAAGATPLDVASKSGRTDLVDLLRKRGTQD
jgi:ankyrin repeat protein